MVLAGHQYQPNSKRLVRRLTFLSADQGSLLAEFKLLDPITASYFDGSICPIGGLLQHQLSFCLDVDFLLFDF